MPFAITMVGQVCSGKTTLLNSLPALQDAVVLSSNQFLTDLVDNGDYNDFPAAHKSRGSWSNRQFFIKLNDTFSSGLDVVIDRLNTASTSRQKLLSLLKGYEHICINVEAPFSLCFERYQKLEAFYSQDDQPNYYRRIPRHVMSVMSSTLQPPSLSEGFDAIINVNSYGKFKSMAGKESELVKMIMMQLD